MKQRDLMMRWLNIKTKRFGTSLHTAKAGFTLMELMITVMIAGTLLAIATLNMNNLVFRSQASRVTDTLVADLHLARMTAMRAKREVTVAFNQPAAGQYTVSWTGADGAVSQVSQLDTMDKRVQFDDTPPGSSPTPDTSFVFNQLGFVQPSSGSLIGNIYVTDTKSGTSFRIATTPAGGIEKRRWLGSAWEGTPLTYTP
jgi:prepilin-type N-terminal cleavage/methylation domain-containing protein